MTEYSTKQRLLVFVVAYNAERTIAKTLVRLPSSLLAAYDTEVLVIDDASKDNTFEAGRRIESSTDFQFKLTVLFNPVNQGYGGNQKIGFHYALEHGFDFVALVHGDGQYAPECLPDLVQPLADGTADAVFGSRMLVPQDALRGGMPFYKFAGNRVLTSIQNWLLRSTLSEFHSGYRVYSVAALRRIPFHLNTNLFHFDSEIIIQLLLARQRIVELPIPTYYGDEICHVNGIKYAWDVLIASATARCQELGLFYDPKYDCQSDANSQYVAKFNFESTHSVAVNKIPHGARVLDLGCARGFIGGQLRKRGCAVVGVDTHPLGDGIQLDEFYLHDLNAIGDLRLDLSRFDWVLLLDVIEHLRSPERFVEALKQATALAPSVKIVATTGNVGFVITRIMLLFGQLNYGKRGILDLTHTRLFTFGTFRRLFDQAGFDVVETHGIVAPFALALGDGRLGCWLLALNRTLVKVRRNLFAYQIMLVLRPRPSLTYLLEQARKASESRIEANSRDRETTTV